MRIAAVLALVLTTLATPVYSDNTLCTCTEPEFVHHFVTKNPDDALYMEEFPWQFLYCAENGDIVVALVAGDNPLLDTYAIDADGHDKIYVEGQGWVRYEDFSRAMARHCQLAPSA